MEVVKGVVFVFILFLFQVSFNMHLMERQWCFRSPSQQLSVHSKKKSTSEHLFWCIRLSQIEDSIEYMEGPNSNWKDHDRNLGVQMEREC